MMSKILEDFNWLKKYSGYPDKCATLEPVIRKATPRRVVGLSITHDGLVGNCPNCRKFVRQQDSKPNVCECTQLLDWSKDE